MQLLFLILSMASVMLFLFGIYMFLRMLIGLALGGSLTWGVLTYHLGLAAIFITLGTWALALYWPQSIFN